MSIADEKYVSITTTRKNGEHVSSPVWIAPLGDGRAAFTTGATSGKVKRIRNNPAVTLRACDMRGRVRPDAAEVSATANVVLGADAAPAEQAILKKYGLFAQLMRLGSGISEAVAKVRKKPIAESCAVVLTLD